MFEVCPELIYVCIWIDQWSWGVWISSWTGWWWWWGSRWYPLHPGNRWWWGKKDALALHFLMLIERNSREWQQSSTVRSTNLEALVQIPTLPLVVLWSQGSYWISLTSRYLICKMGFIIPTWIVLAMRIKSRKVLSTMPKSKHDTQTSSYRGNSIYIKEVKGRLDWPCYILFSLIHCFQLLSPQGNNCLPSFKYSGG